MRGTLVEVNKEQRRRILSTQASLRLHLGRLNPSRAHVSPVTSLFTVSRSHEGSPLPNRNGAMTACRTACRPPSHAQDCSPPPSDALELCHLSRMGSVHGDCPLGPRHASS